MSIGSARYQSFRVTGDCRLPLQLEAHREELELISCMLQDHSDEEYCLSAEMGYMHVDSLGDEFYTALICPIYHHKERTKCYLEIGSNGIQLCVSDPSLPGLNLNPHYDLPEYSVLFSIPAVLIGDLIYELLSFIQTGNELMGLYGYLPAPSMDSLVNLKNEVESYLVNREMQFTLVCSSYVAVKKNGRIRSVLPASKTITCDDLQNHLLIELSPHCKLFFIAGLTSTVVSMSVVNKVISNYSVQEVKLYVR